MAKTTASEPQGIVLHPTKAWEPMFVSLAREYPDGIITEKASTPGIGASKISTRLFLAEFDESIRLAYEAGRAAGRKEAADAAG